MPTMVPDAYVGAWQSSPSLTRTIAGHDFYLDITIAKDGTLSGVWDAYVWVTIPLSGPYSFSAQGGKRANRPSPVSGWFDFSTRQGEIALKSLGRTAFAVESVSSEQLKLELPRHWLSQETPVLFQSTITKNSPAGSEVQASSSLHSSTSGRQEQPQKTANQAGSGESLRNAALLAALFAAGKGLQWALKRQQEHQGDPTTPAGEDNQRTPRFCPACGEPYLPEARFCMRCGAPKQT